MQAMDDIALLREYATNNSEAAFEALVSQRVNFVYSAALRQVYDPHLAEEVTQAVFIILAQKAGRISDRTILSGWLFKTTHFAALAQTLAAIKRQQREQEVYMQSEIQQTAPDPLWEQISPLLDEALATLGEADRQAVLLRYFENKSLAEVGKHQGTGEDTARKRVNRALEKLHRFCFKRGVVSTTVFMAGVMAANSVREGCITVVLACEILSRTRRLTFVSATDEQGRDIELAGFNEPGNLESTKLVSYSFAIRPLEGARELNLVIAVSESKIVEFLAKPVQIKE
jgi:RNA polymerase sigma factor (sigma-70 family)